MLVSSLTDTRTEHINNYNAAVETWTTGGTGVWSNYDNTRAAGNFNMSFPNLGINAQLGNLTTAESYIEDNDSRIREYSAYIRFYTGAAVDLSSRCSEFEPWNGCDVSTNLSTFSLYLNGQRIYGATIPAFTRTQTRAASKAHCSYGDFWNTMQQTCDAYSMISTICLKLRQTTGGWSIDNTFSGPGCGLSTWQVAAYDRLWIQDPTDFPGMVYIPITVRSVLDPRVQFYGDVGTGAVSFGLTQGAKARAGVTLLCIGSLLLFCLCGTAFKLVRLDQKHRHYEEVRPAGMVYTQVAQPVVFQQQPYAAAPPGYYQQQPVYYQQGPPPGQQVPIAYGPTQ